MRFSFVNRNPFSDLNANPIITLQLSRTLKSNLLATQYDNN